MPTFNSSSVRRILCEEIHVFGGAVWPQLAEYLKGYWYTDRHVSHVLPNRAKGSVNVPVHIANGFALWMTILILSRCVAGHLDLPDFKISAIFVANSIFAASSKGRFFLPNSFRNMALSRKVGAVLTVAVPLSLRTNRNDGPKDLQNRSSNDQIKASLGVSALGFEALNEICIGPLRLFMVFYVSCLKVLQCVSQNRSLSLILRLSLSLLPILPLFVQRIALSVQLFGPRFQCWIISVQPTQTQTCIQSRARCTRKFPATIKFGQ